MRTKCLNLCGRASALAIAALLVAGVVSEGLAQTAVTSIGDVSPIDLPFVPGDQGIPTSGTTVITSGVNADGDPIDAFGNILLDEQDRPIGQFNYERSANVEVGRYSVGQLLMTGGAELRFGDLLIGGDVDRPEGSNFNANDLDVENDFGDGSTSGVGLVEIIGAGTVYNNHPGIIPTQYQSADPEVPSFTIPEAYDPSPALGGVEGSSDEITNIRRGGDAFDLYVGLTGTGTLNILESGRAEIRDGALIGIAPNAVGVVNVDGLGSYLGVYGMKNPVTGGGGGDGAEEMIVGLYGEGRLNITNGGQVDSFNRAALGALDGSGEEGDISYQGGHGVVLVEGAGSLWRISAPEAFGDDDESLLAIGRYYNDVEVDTRIDGLLSDVSAYIAEDGRGTLRIRDGGLVTVHEDDLDDDDDDAAVRIGLFGELQLNGGRIVAGGRLDNDGLIRTGDNEGGIDRYGDGVIESGLFLNSPLGQVRVRAGEHLQFRNQADDGEADAATVTAGATTSTYYYANAGKIEVLGDQAVGKAEIEFIREHDPSVNGTAADNRFKNLYFVDVPDQSVAGMSDVWGQIVAQDANLYFRSDLLNEGDLAFVGGDNVVTGNIENTFTGYISITNESHVTFQDNVVNDGLILLNDESDVTFLGSLTGAGALIDLNPAAITVTGDFQTDGHLDFVIGGGPTGLDFTRLGVLGTSTFGAGSTLSIDALSLTGVTAGSSFELMSFQGGVIDGDLLTTIALPTAPAGLTFVPDLFLDDGDYTLSVIALDPGIIGADFNGDGIVDAADIAIWQAFFGLESGATGALGDADGDGDVDGVDLGIINMQLGGPPAPVASPVVVPEPQTAALVMATVAAFGVRRRRWIGR